MKKLIGCGLAAAAAAMAFGAPARADDVLHAGKASPTSSPMLPLNVGVKTGMFARQGLDVEVSDFLGGGKLHQAMAAGSMDIGVGAGPEMALIAKGSPELAICNEVPSVRFLGIMVPADSPAKTLDDLKGKKIGVSSTGSLTNWLALELARKKAWGPQGVQVVAIGSASASMVAAFRAHVVDADIGPTSLAFDMELHNQGRLLAPVSEYEGNLSGGTIFATTALIAKTPDAIRRFLAAWFDIIAWMHTHKDDTVKIESDVTGFPPVVMAKEYDLTISMFSETCRFDAESLANLERSFTDLKLVETPPDMAKLYTEAFLPKQ
jgi:ABC-type nitrate/sulfonate/bicarbonate transport system substrate-binding protein